MDTSKSLFFYNNIICNDSNRINFIYAINKGIPPLAVCVKEIENYYLYSPSNQLGLTNHAEKQTIGRMIKTSLFPLGYILSGSRSINSRFFSNTATYKTKNTNSS